MTSITQLIKNRVLDFKKQNEKIKVVCNFESDAVPVCDSDINKYNKNMSSKSIPASTRGTFRSKIKELYSNLLKPECPQLVIEEYTLVREKELFDSSANEEIYRRMYSDIARDMRAFTKLLESTEVSLKEAIKKQ